MRPVFVLLEKLGEHSALRHPRVPPFPRQDRVQVFLHCHLLAEPTVVVSENSIGVSLHRQLVLCELIASIELTKKINKFNVVREGDT